MKTTIEERWGTHPDDVKGYDSARLRKEFLVSGLFEAGAANMVYTHNDRLIIGGALPVMGALRLEAAPLLRADYFCERREVGVICTGGEGVVSVDGSDFPMAYKDGLYVGRGAKEVVFRSNDPHNPARYYFASAPAHKEYPVTRVTADMRVVKELGGFGASNARVLNQIIISGIVDCCQLQMGLTELKEGSVWNTMPMHTHSRRMEAYFYFNVPRGEAVCHFMGERRETRHIFVSNEEAVISPSWSVHSAAGTTNYAFIWAMCGENLDYDDMDSFGADKIR
ncbi:MAG: 5-dehydro-4-deoxy-D-glucuronate isomerase [Tannerellaceae bacterium]|jgi:4-deoxy-L-threo-5-hexosulose-uronate ketol-isomerase|nr:5-dehydro-4-deoxy-D-glucuronate isomerase [Tannerellaceae bacterium]